ncbi:hypothetical protein HYS47_01120 [Candidatus Woesearchaeota archaeon]|nr:hypothetical protein [Candidatus Woesearchaeota archaeon]
MALTASTISLEERLTHAQDLEFQGKFVEAEAILTELIDTAGEARADTPYEGFQRSVAHNLRGLVRRMQGKRLEAMMDYITAGLVAASYRKSGVPTIQEPLSWINIADLYRGFGQFDLARCALNTAKETNISGVDTEMDYVKAKQLDQFGLVRVAEQKWTAAIAMYESALEQVSTYFEFIEEEREEGANDEDIEDMLSDLQMSRRDVVRLKSNILQHLAIAIEYSKNETRYAEAHQLLDESLELAKSIDDKTGILNVVTATARLRNQTGHHLDALQLYKNALEVVDGTDYARGKATIRLHYAIVCLELQLLDQAAPLVDAFCKDVHNGSTVQGDYPLYGPYVDRLAALAEQHRMPQLSDIKQVQEIMKGK